MSDDLLDQLAGLSEKDAAHAVRHQREKVVQATQGSYDALFDASLPDLSLPERLYVALYASALTPNGELALHYKERLLALSPAPTSVRENVNALVLCAIEMNQLEAVETLSAREKAILKFTHTLIAKPIDGDKAALLALPSAGLSPAAVIALAQLIAFLSYQTRLLAGIQAMKHAGAGAVVDSSSAGNPKASIAANPSSGPISQTLKINGFTNESLEWKAWLPTVDLATANADQIAVLEESHPKAKTSDYYLSLAHQPHILRERSTAFNAIMYAPGGMSRAERELGSTVVSRINGCVYCASVHAQRFEQMAKRQDVIAQVFEDPFTAGTTSREKAICTFSAAVTLAPDRLGADDIKALRAEGLNDLEVLDLLHSVAIFAWANRLMLNLGEPVFA